MTKLFKYGSTKIRPNIIICDVMDYTKKQLKERKIIEAAEIIFARDGFHQAIMEDIAQQAGITKVTLYSYFQSKENLYYGVIHRAFQELIEIFYTTIDNHRNSTGLDATMAIFQSFYQFCEDNFLYSEAILDYFSMVRNIARASQGQPPESIYFAKIQDLQNLPIKLTIKEINRGIRDKSIKRDVDPMLHTIQGWTMVVGYIKILIASGRKDEQLFMNVDLTSLKTLSLSLAEKALAKS